MAFVAKAATKILAQERCRLLNFQHFCRFICTFFTSSWRHDLMLAALWGSIICGFGLGLVFRAGGNTGGTDIIAQAVSKRFGIPSGTAIIIVDILIIIAAIPVFSLETVCILAWQSLSQENDRLCHRRTKVRALRLYYFF